MPTFYFDINTGSTRRRDLEGSKHASFEEARKEAQREIALLIRDEFPDGDRVCITVTVRDENGIPVYVASASFVGETLV